MIEDFKDIVDKYKTEMDILLNQTIYNIENNNGVYEYYPYIIKSVSPYGSCNSIVDGIPKVWNIYAEDNYCKTYKSFYELGRTFTFDEIEADKICKELNEKKE